MKNYYELVIQEYTLKVELYSKLFDLAMNMHDYDMAENYADDLHFNSKQLKNVKNDYEEGKVRNNAI